MMINSPDSIKALLNIAEFIMVTGGDTSMATLWLKYGLKIAEKLDNKPKARVLMTIGRICAEKEQVIARKLNFLVHQSRGSLQIMRGFVET